MELGALASLNVLYVGRNQLTGCIPTTLRDVPTNDLAGLGLPYCDGPQPLGPETDREALVALYHATDGPNWRNNSGWLSDAPLGEWRGVGTDAAGRVVGLSLTYNRLSGELPPELGSLANLQHLFLQDNELSGEIPLELGNLANLRTLCLMGNQLSGEIPAELGNLANLRALRLSQNALSGKIPPELGNLASLTELDLSDNQLSGEVPRELGNLANLKYLNLAWGNQLTGCIPAKLRDLPVGLPYCDERAHYEPPPTPTAADAAAPPS